jgi:hypothetical protein
MIAKSRFFNIIKCLTIIIIVIYFAAFFIDFFFLNNDGIIKNVFLHRLVFRIAIILCLIGLLGYFSYSKFKILKFIGFNGILSIGFLWFLEFVSFMFFKFHNNVFDNPSHINWYENPNYRNKADVAKKYYGDLNPQFGRWRTSNFETSIIRCSDSAVINYKSNSYGARDKPRNKFGKNRIIILGDSFSEGILVNVGNRCSDLLESKTKLEHLNFGIIGANTVSYSIIYKQLIHNQFEHNSIVTFVFPANDFDSFNKPIDAKIINFPSFGPYMQLSNNNKPVLKHNLANMNGSIEAEKNKTTDLDLRNTRDSLYLSTSFFKKILLEFELNSYIVSLIKLWCLNKSKENSIVNYRSNFHSPPFSAEETSEFELGINQLLETSKDIKKIFVLIPILEDIKSFKKSKINRLTPYLKKKYESQNLKIIDLLPYFVNHPNPASLYIPCDGHWSDEGNKFVGEIIMKDDFYKKEILKN